MWGLAVLPFRFDYVFPEVFKTGSTETSLHLPGNTRTYLEWYRITDIRRESAFVTCHQLSQLNVHASTYDINMWMNNQIASTTGTSTKRAQK